MEAARPLYRSTTDRRIAGVAAGVATYLAIDTLWVRVAWVWLGLLGGVGLLLYLLAWVIMADQDGRYSSLPLFLTIALLIVPALVTLAWLYPVMVVATYD